MTDGRRTYSESIRKRRLHASDERTNERGVLYATVPTTTTSTASVARPLVGSYRLFHTLTYTHPYTHPHSQSQISHRAVTRHYTTTPRQTSADDSRQSRVEEVQQLYCFPFFSLLLFCPIFFPFLSPSLPPFSFPFPSLPWKLVPSNTQLRCLGKHCKLSQRGLVHFSLNLTSSGTNCRTYLFFRELLDYRLGNYTQTENRPRL